MENKEAAELLKDIRKVIANEMVVDLKAIYKKEEHTHLIKDVYVQALDKAILVLDIDDLYRNRQKQQCLELEKATKINKIFAVFCFALGLLNLLCIFGVI